MRSACILSLWLFAWTQPARALPEDPGSLAFDKISRTETLAGQTVAFDLYLPTGLAQPAPIVVVGHGFQRKKGNMTDWGEELARRGYVAAVPDFPGLLPDHALNGKVVSGLLAWMETEGNRATSSLAGKVDGTRRAALGFSAGGLAVLLAASADPSIDVVVGIDPVDNGGQGVKAAPAIKAPVTFARGEPSSCNSNGNAAAIFAALTAPRLSLKVSKATHCDGESPTGPLCEMMCGAQDKARHLLFRRYAFATLDFYLLCKAGMAPWLGGSSAKSDPGITDLVAQAGFPTTPSCAAAPDAGSPADAGPSADMVATGDGATTPDSGTSPDTASFQPDAAASGDHAPSDNNGGCSCHQACARQGPSATGVLAFLALLFLWRRRPS